MLIYYDLDVVQGSTFSAQLSVKNADGSPVNLTGYDVRGFIKYSYGSNSVLLNLNPVVNITAPLTKASGVIDVRLTAAQTSTLPITVGVYDIETYNNDGEVNKVLDGKVRIHPEVTK